MFYLPGSVTQLEVQQRDLTAVVEQAQLVTPQARQAERLLAAIAEYGERLAIEEPPITPAPPVH